MRRVIAVSVVAIACGGISFAAEAPLKGAAAVMKSVNDAAGAVAPAEKPHAPEDAWKAEVKAYRASQASLSTEDQVKQWLALFDKYSEMKLERPGGSSFSFSFGSDSSGYAPLFHALPPPAAWDALAAAVRARPAATGGAAQREAALRIVADALMADSAAILQDIEKAMAASEQEAGSSMGGMVNPIVQAAAVIYGDPKSMAKRFEKSLEDAEKQQGYGYIQVPNLVALAGEAEATRLVKRVLSISTERVSWGNDIETLRVARKAALESIDTLKAPIWDLAMSTNAVELYEAFDKKFGPYAKAEDPSLDAEDEPGARGGAVTIPGRELGGDPSSPANQADAATGEIEKSGAAMQDAISRLQNRVAQGQSRGAREEIDARFFYMLGLIARGRMDDAKRVGETFAARTGATALQPSILLELSTAENVSSIYNFLHESLTADPRKPYWSALIELGGRAGQTARTLELIDSALKSGKVSGNLKSQLETSRIAALLADDQTDAAAAAMRAMISQEPTGKAAMAMALRSSEGPWAMQLAQLGAVLEKPEWISEGLAALDAASKATDEESEEPDVLGLSRITPEFLLKAGRLAEAEAAIEKSMSAQMKIRARELERMKAAGGADAESLIMGESALDLAGELSTLARVYGKAGRWADVVALLNDSPYWAGKDVVDIGIYGDDGEFQTLVARALSETGEKPAALKALEAGLRRGTLAGHDPAYELYLEIKGADSMAFLEELAALDAFEERPLIWKASLQLKAGNTDAAMTTIQKAIAIDPSDGEQGKDLRMKAYAVLADIHKAKGAVDQEQLYRGVVHAIRISERADEFYAVGLLKRSIRMYEEALAIFSDAYCIQSRIAIRMEQAGDLKGAEAHFRKAYELMPTSFGQMETHCFGCEGVFASPVGQKIAESVFAKLIQDQPNKPQAHYLMGYLRESQGNHADAAASYRKALELDPDYLSVLHKFAQSEPGGSGLSASMADRDKATMSLIRLDPEGRHGSFNATGVADLKSLWTAIETRNRRVASRPSEMYTLKASAARAAEIEQRKKAAGIEEDDDRLEMLRYGYMQEAQAIEPAEAVSNQAVVSAAIQMLDNARMTAMYSSLSSFSRGSF